VDYIVTTGSDRQSAAREEMPDDITLHLKSLTRLKSFNEKTRDQQVKQTAVRFSLCLSYQVTLR